MTFLCFVVLINSEIRQAESEKWEDGIGRKEEQGVPGESCLTCQEKGGIRCG